jgi:transmembrane sensor
MPKIINVPDRGPSDRADIEAEVRAWVIQIDGGPPKDEEIRELHSWLRRSPFHKQAFSRAASLCNNLDELSSLFSAESEQRTKTAATPVTNRHFRSSRSRLAMISVLLVIGLLTGIKVHIFVPQLRQHNGFVAEYETAIGEIQAVALPDGSSVRLNTDSVMSVSYSKEARAVRLAEGEAYFVVAHDSDKPFVVVVGRFAVQAVGTAFSVHVIDEGVDLTVTDGRIEVTSLREPVSWTAALDLERIRDAASRVSLVAGQHVIFNERNDQLELVQRIEPQEIEKKLSWRDGMLIFDNDSLEDVVSELNRYTPIKIVISDASIRNLRFGGYFRAGDIASIMATLQEGFGIRVEHINENLIYLSRQQNSNN